MKLCYEIMLGYEINYQKHYEIGAGRDGHFRGMEISEETLTSTLEVWFFFSSTLYRYHFNENKRTKLKCFSQVMPVNESLCKLRSIHSMPHVAAIGKGEVGKTCLLWRERIPEVRLTKRPVPVQYGEWDLTDVGKIPQTRACMQSELPSRLPE